jgi:hypothetical protein
VTRDLILLATSVYLTMGIYKARFKSN